jgi:acyl-CoA thioesterase
MIHPFDDAVALSPLAEGRWQGRTTAAYANMTGPFGGITAATLLNAVLSDPRASGAPVSVTVNYVAAIADGAFEIAARLVRGGKYIQHWALDLTQDGQPKTTASVVLGQRAAPFSHHSAAPPEAPPPADCAPPANMPPLAWIDRYDTRFAAGAIGSRAEADPFGPTRSVVWIADTPPRPLDALSLLAMSDSFILRIVHLRGARVVGGTVSLTTHFLATPDDIARQGAAPLLGYADATRFHANFHDQHMQLWSTDGTLLASGSQIVWFRD